MERPVTVSQNKTSKVPKIRKPNSDPLTGAYAFQVSVPGNQLHSENVK
jgi:hypothetical protein